MIKLPKQLVLDQVEEAIRLGSREILVVIEGDRGKAKDFHHALVMYLGHSLRYPIESNSLRMEVKVRKANQPRIRVTHAPDIGKPQDAYGYTGMQFETIIYNKVMTFHAPVVRPMEHVQYMMSRVRACSNRRK